MTVTFFGSGVVDSENKLYTDAFHISKLLAENRIAVCTGGYLGTMEAVSKAASEYGGEIIGVTLEGGERNSKPNPYITKEYCMPNLIKRIWKLIELGDAYIIFKGGTGTLVEIAAALEFMNKKMIPEKKLIFYTDFWKNVIETLKNDSESLTALIERNVHFVNSPVEILALLQ